MTSLVPSASPTVSLTPLSVNLGGIQKLPTVLYLPRPTLNSKLLFSAKMAKENIFAQTHLPHLLLRFWCPILHFFPKTFTPLVDTSYDMQLTNKETGLYGRVMVLLSSWSSRRMIVGARLMHVPMVRAVRPGSSLGYIPRGCWVV